MKRSRWTKWLVVGLASIIVAASAGSAVAMGKGRLVTPGATPGTGSCVVTTTDATATSLSRAEEDAVLFMREEEKLARDVYLALYDTWGTGVFQNIAASEARHMASVLTLIERYSLTDPASDQLGVFTNTELQAAYTNLVTKGSASLSAALEVGVAVEKLDIEDLETHLAESAHADITRVFQNLLNGSENHLSAFERLMR
jgi:hypothetical protein